MGEVTQLMQTLKQQLKLQGKTYRDLAQALNLSEPSVKRMFGTGRIGVDRLVEASNFLGFTLSELTQEAVAGELHIRTLNEIQEKELVSNTKLLLVAVCALNHWSVKDVLDVYRFSESECLQCLLRLDRLRLISLLPGNRIRLNVSRDFDWIAEGPIEQYFRSRGLNDFLNSAFVHADESQAFANGMLTEAAMAKMKTELTLLRRKFAELHEESLSAPLEKRRGCGLFLAMREWEPPEFVALRRPDSKNRNLNIRAHKKKSSGG